MQGNLIHFTVDPGGLNLVTEFADHDAMARPRTVFQHRGPNDAVVTALDYDAMGRLVRKTVDPGGLNLVTGYRYDAAGNLLTINEQPSRSSARGWRSWAG